MNEHAYCEDRSYIEEVRDRALAVMLPKFAEMLPEGYTLGPDARLRRLDSNLPDFVELRAESGKIVRVPAVGVAPVAASS